jgi:hypothetical protein
MSKAAMEAKEANSDKFYRAKEDLFFCTQVVALASVATAAIRSMALIEGAGALFSKELEKVNSICPGVSDWREMPDESIHWTLALAAQRMSDASDRMESAFMAEEREGGNA